jgi:5-methylcytosine-specific restriction endonuclease McrA
MALCPGLDLNRRLRQTTAMRDRRAAYFKNPCARKNLHTTKRACGHCGKTMYLGNLAQHEVGCLAARASCGECGCAIPHFKKFCSSSCSATYSNKRRTRQSKARHPCAHCDAQTGNPKFCSQSCANEFKIASNEKEAKKWTGQRTSIIRRILIREQSGCCACCGLSTWMDRPIPLELDHVDGNSQNWARGNLRMLCPNCHSQTPTFRARNRGNGRAYRRKKLVPTGGIEPPNHDYKT